jgi:hypothetical protein
MFLRVIKVEYLRDYQLQLTFNNGSVILVDLEGKLDGPIFKPLQDPDYFRQVSVNNETNTIEWPNGADFAPEYLIEIGEPVPEFAP